MEAADMRKHLPKGKYLKKKTQLTKAHTYLGLTEAFF